MIPIIYESTETAFTTNGLGRLRDCISAVCVEERNGVYETNIEYPVGGANYELLQIGRIIGVTHDETGVVEPFDIVSMERPINGVVTVHCVHISYRLTGITTWAKNINSLAAALGVFNGISGNPFSFSADFTSGAYMAAFDGVPRTVRQLMGGVEGSILDAYGGEWEFSRYNAILHRSRGQTRDFAIRYGVNMLDYDESIDYEGAYNSCVPFWTGTDDKGASVVVRGSRVDSGQMLPNGRRVVAPLDLSEKFEEKPTAAQLQTMAASVMNARRPYLPAQNIKVDFIRLQDFAGYEDFAALLQCNLCDTINVVFPAYETQAPFKIVKTTWDILDGKYTEMELGQLSTTLSEALGITGGGTFTETAGGGVSDVMMNGASVVDPDGIAMVTDANGNLELDGTLTLQNAKNILAKDTGNTERAILSMSGNNNTVLGYGGYAANQGGTNIYGDIIRLYSHNAIVTNQPIAELVKLTEYQFSTPAMNAHTYEATTSATLPAQTGYIPVGIVGWRVGNYHVNAFNLRLNGRTIYGGFSNPYNSNVAASTCTVNVLWLKATEA